MKKAVIILILIFMMFLLWVSREKELQACNGNQACEYRVLKGY